MKDKMPILRQFNSLASGKQLVFYEGGPHITNQTTCTAVSGAIAPLQTDVKMHNMYKDWLDSLRTLSNATLFNHFVITGAGPMGVLSNIYQTTSQKYQVLTDYINNCQFAIGISENKIQIDLISVYPNPFSEQATLLADNFLRNAALEIYNCFGQAVKEIKNIFGQTITLHRDNLPAGFYFIRLIQNGKLITTKKIIIVQ